jgi:alkyl sulfatase BDS1-like metallo-beta-lactamase superfamily hydrolase
MRDRRARAYSNERSIAAQVDELIDTRPGKELLTPVYDDPAFRIRDFIFRSGGCTASYLVRTTKSRIVINTGMGWEAPHHKRVFDAITTAPTRYIITTQAHVDHVGGVAHFREPGTVYVAQANNAACQRDDARIPQLRAATAMHWFAHNRALIERLAAENPGVPPTQDTPTPDLTFDRRLALGVDDLDVELISTPGGETIDSCVVWLPEHRICFISNLLGPLFPHFPNFNTLRGDRYRFVEPYLAAVRTLRELRPELLIVGRYLPIEGAAVIDGCLARLHDAVDWVHRETLAGMNAGKDVYSLMRDVQLPPHLRVGQKYGKVSWCVRTIWESYVGWFKLRSTSELYPNEPADALVALVEAAGVDVALTKAQALLDEGSPVPALQLAEAVMRVDPACRPAIEIFVAAHRRLLRYGGDTNFWESGWLREEIARGEQLLGELPQA